MNHTNLKIHVFYCSNSMEQDQLKSGLEKKPDVELKSIGLPCSGKIDIPYLMKAFETGADGVALVTCKQGECQHLEGNLRARRRSEAVDSLLDEIGLGKGRMAFIMLEEKGVEQALNEIRNFIGRVAKLPRPTAVAA